MSLRSRISLAIGTRTATGLAVFALVAGGTAAVTLTATHGTPASTPGSVVNVAESDSSSGHQSDASSPKSTTDVDASRDSHSTSSENHGSVVTAAVAACKAAEDKSETTSASASSSEVRGHEGIGRCVSAVANGKSTSSAATEVNGRSDNHPTPHPHPTPHM